MRASAADTANTPVDRLRDFTVHGQSAIGRGLLATAFVDSSQEVNQKCHLVAVPCQPIDHPESCSSMYSMNIKAELLACFMRCEG